MEHLERLIKEAKLGDEVAMEVLLNQFEPLFIKYATRNGGLDLDCKQELAQSFVKGVHQFDYDRLNKR